MLGNLNFIFANGPQLSSCHEKQQGGEFWICTLLQGQKYHFQVDNVEQMKIKIYFQILEKLLFVGVGKTKHDLEKKKRIFCEDSEKYGNNLSNGCLLKII